MATLFYFPPQKIIKQLDMTLTSKANMKTKPDSHGAITSVDIQG
jgi:hypothetical protein